MALRSKDLQISELPFAFRRTYKIDMYAVGFYLPFMLIYILHGKYVVSDFIYEDFESTIGIDFNGVASTSSCDEGKRLAYQVNHGSADVNLKTPPSTTEEDTNQVQFQETIMENVDYKSLLLQQRPPFWT